MILGKSLSCSTPFQKFWFSCQELVVDVTAAGNFILDLRSWSLMENKKQKSLSWKRTWTADFLPSSRSSCSGQISARELWFVSILCLMLPLSLSLSARCCGGVCFVVFFCHIFPSLAFWLWCFLLLREIISTESPVASSSVCSAGVDTPDYSIYPVSSVCSYIDAEINTFALWRNCAFFNINVIYA